MIDDGERTSRFSIVVSCVLGVLFAVFFFAVVSAEPVYFAWDANTETDLAGYKLYVGPGSGQYTTTIDVGNVTTFSIDVTSDIYAALTAYDEVDNESEKSDEVRYVIKPAGSKNLRSDE